jgi:hypothetical protein
MPPMNFSNRGLEQQVADLQRQVRDLTKVVNTFKAGNYLQLAAHQKGPLPGYMRAVQINDVGLGSSMWLNLNGNIPGIAPYQAITDANKVVRAELGNLAANGVSPAQFGFRANSGAGTPIFDSLGLIGVMTLLGSSSTSGQSFTTTTPTLVTNSAITFVLARAARVLVLITALGNSSNNTGNIDLDLGGVQQAGGSWLQWGFNGPSVTSSFTWSDSLTAGSHTYDLRGYLDALPGPFTCLGTLMYVYLLGS